MALFSMQAAVAEPRETRRRASLNLVIFGQTVSQCVDLGLRCDYLWAGQAVTTYTAVSVALLLVRFVGYGAVLVA
jgi:hypothetical protein